MPIAQQQQSPPKSPVRGAVAPPLQIPHSEPEPQQQQQQYSSSPPRFAMNQPPIATEYSYLSGTVGNPPHPVTAPAAWSPSRQSQISALVAPFATPPSIFETFLQADHYGGGGMQQSRFREDMSALQRLTTEVSDLGHHIQRTLSSSSQMQAELAWKQRRSAAMVSNGKACWMDKGVIV